MEVEMEKKKISRFEFAIFQHIQPEKAKEVEPYTAREERQQRSDKINNDLSRLRVKKA